MSKRLVDLNPRWITGDGGREKVGVSFDCPACPGCYANPQADRWEDGSDVPYRVYVAFSNPLDGGGPGMSGPHWERTGGTFDAMTLSPSVDGSSFGHWHGWVKNGACE